MPWPFFSRMADDIANINLRGKGFGNMLKPVKHRRKKHWKPGKGKSLKFGLA